MQKVVVYKMFIMEGFYWENLSSVLDRWSLLEVVVSYKSWSQMEVQVCLTENRRSASR